MSGFGTLGRAGRGAWAVAVAVTEAAIVLMFSKRKDDMEEVFFVLGVGVLGRVGQSLFLCNLSVMILLFFFGRAPAGYKLQ